MWWSVSVAEKFLEMCLFCVDAEYSLACFRGPALRYIAIPSSSMLHKLKRLGIGMWTKIAELPDPWPPIDVA